MAFELPVSLSPSKVSSFTNCALSFRFSSIDKIPSPPTIATVKGTLVHSALEHLFSLEPPSRTLDAALDALATARVALNNNPEWRELALDEHSTEEFIADAMRLVHTYFTMEDPSTINPIGNELRVEQQLPTDNGSSVLLRGIIDRLERDADGNLIVSDYKTGKSPKSQYASARLTGVHIYAWLCEQIYGERPTKVQLLFLGDGQVVEAFLTEQSSRQIERKLRSIWSTIETACSQEDFRPRKSPLCSWCSYQQWCPEFGGDPAQARPEFLASGRPYAPAPPGRRD